MRDARADVTELVSFEVKTNAKLRANSTRRGRKVHVHIERKAERERWTGTTECGTFRLQRIDGASEDVDSRRRRREHGVPNRVAGRSVQRLVEFSRILSDEVHQISRATASERSRQRFREIGHRFGADVAL